MATRKVTLGTVTYKNRTATILEDGKALRDCETGDEYACPFHWIQQVRFEIDFEAIPPAMTMHEFAVRLRERQQKKAQHAETFSRSTDDTALNK